METVLIAGLITLLGGGGIAAALIAAFKKLLNAALDNMKANTRAIDAHSEATRSLSKTLEQNIAIQNERDKSLFRQLDRIERATGR
jgi:hypothetical protein